ncbi:MAG TPA: ROK family protein [Ignavibacteriaceae bacterium]|nr:ROK family protein [Ignavibacteriaceae bacterium]
MSKQEKYAIGVDLGGTNVKVGIVSQNGKIIKKVSVETKAKGGPEKVIQQIKKGIDEVLNKNELRIHGIGIGSPGTVSTKKGTVEDPPNLPGWEKVNLGKIIQKEFKIDVKVENDANAAAIGEMIFGAGKSYESFVMVTLGTGVGGGIIYNRKLFRGEFGAAGEIGHISIDINGPQCKCGSFGCVETYLGNSYIVKNVQTELEKYRSSKIWQLVNNDLNLLTPIIIQTALEQGDEYAKGVVQSLGKYLGTALASVGNCLDNGTFIIGGGVGGFGAPLFNSVKETISARVLKPLRKRIKVLPAKLKNDAGIKGASALAFYK